MNNMNDMFEQAKKLQANLSNIQKQIADLLITGESGGGLVKVTLNGLYNVKGIDIDASVWNEEHSVITDLISAAFNNASNKTTEEIKQVMTGVAQSVNIPNGN